MPGVIPTDGTTITVNVDGITLGHPTYNQFRGDIATEFTGFANSNGAIGFSYIDTTKLTNGLHTISWNVWDNELRGNGVGSRFFTVLNVAGSTTSSPAAPSPAEASAPTPSELVESSLTGCFHPIRPSIGALADEVLSMEVEEMDRSSAARSDVGVPGGQWPEATVADWVHSPGWRVLLATGAGLS